MDRRYLPMFAGFTEFTPGIPKLYWNVKSQEQRIKILSELLHKLVCYSDSISNQVNENTTDISELQNEFAEFIASGFEDYYEEQLETWIHDNLPLIWKTIAKQVYFALNDDGYFVAYIPESWSDITFDTGHVYGRSDYGRLILQFNADDAIDNTYSYSYNAAETLELEQAIADLETIIGRSDLCYDTLFTNLDEEV